MKKKIGIVARCDRTGLAVQAHTFWKNLYQISEVMVVLSGQRDNPLIYPKGKICERGMPGLEEIDKFLGKIDVLIAFETPYNWNLFSRAKKKGIKTVLIPNYEWSAEFPPVEPDLYLCLSKLDYDLMPENKKYLPMPIDRNESQFKLRKKAQTFVFNNGNGGTNKRNGIDEFLEAIPLVKANVNFLIRSQVPIKEINDKRVKVELGSIPHEELFKQGDVFVFPHKFDGLSLPIQEALSAGMPVLTTDFYPHNTYLPKEWLFKPASFRKARMGPETREIDVALITPSAIARKIEQWAGKDITKESKMADKIAETFDWDILRDKFTKLFEEL